MGQGLITSLLTVHNSNLVDISTPAVPADTMRGIAGSGPTSRWSGICQALVQSDTLQSIIGGQLLLLTTTMVTLPRNIPVYPNANDLMTFNFLEGWMIGQSIVLEAREIADKFALLGKIMITARQS